MHAMVDQPVKRKTRRFVDLSGQVHEYTFSCYRRMKMLDRDRTREWFVESMALARKRFDVLLIAYVIMPEHAHVLLLPGTNVRMDEFAKSLKQSVARKAIGWLRKERPAFLAELAGEFAGNRTRYHFWQPGGGYDRNMDNPKTVLAAIDYVHANPIRRRLVKTAEDWVWSSARFYAGLDNVKVPMDRVEL